MVSSNTLLPLIQFVALITPALAILMELLVRFHGGLSELQETRDIPVEIQVLLLGFSALLFGGMIIGMQLLTTFSDRITQIATFLIFGALPLLAFSVLIVNIRLTDIGPDDVGVFGRLRAGFRVSASIVSPILLSLALYLGIVNSAENSINTSINWWVFHEIIDPSWFFYAASIYSTYLVLYVLWSNGLIPTSNLSSPIENWFVVSFTVLSFYLLLAGPVFIFYFFLNNLGMAIFSDPSPVGAIPYIWMVILMLALPYTDLNPDSD